MLIYPNYQTTFTVMMKNLFLSQLPLKSLLSGYQK